MVVIALLGLPYYTLDSIKRRKGIKGGQKYMIFLLFKL